MPFRFPLQPVLDQRTRTEEHRMLEVAALDRERILIENRLKDLQSRIHAAKHDLRSRLSSSSPSQREGAGGWVLDASDSPPQSVSILDVRLQANASLHLTAQAQRVALELAGAYHRVEASRKRLLQATTARKAVETLKERRRAEWKYEQSRREFAQLDEILTARSSPTHPAHIQSDQP